MMMMASPTMQPREPHHISRESSNMRPESTTSAGSARSWPRGRKHSHTADGIVRSVEAAKAMEDLEVETGFASYAAYFESLGYNPAYQGPHWDRFKQKLRSCYRTNSVCAIIDLFTEEASPPKASLRGENLSADQALQSLRTPSKGVAVQIVFWSSDEAFQNLHLDFLTVFGLGFKLGPRFFRALATNPRCDILNGNAVNEQSLSEYFFVGGTIVAIARNCPLAKPGAPPILLVAAIARLDYHIDTSALYYPTREAHSIRNSGVSQDIVRDPEWYAWLLTTAMNQNPDCTVGCEALLFGSLLPFLQLDILRMRTRCSRVRAKFQPAKALAINLIKFELEGEPWTFIEGILDSMGEHTADAGLYQYRLSLRSFIEAFEGVSQPWSRFISSQLTPQFTTSPAYNRNAEERNLLLKEAHSLEAEIREYLQLQAGQLSLVESRKSIEVSNTQLQESKRVKIFTILAFVYLPLNLATGIFGMNLQQLNGSGKNVRYFIGTAIIALTITGGSWWLAEQLSSLRAWRKRDPESYKGPVTLQYYGHSAPNYSILVRAAMLAWLVTNGHWFWMVQSGAGWCTLTNSRKGYKKPYTGPLEGVCAGDYLSYAIRPTLYPQYFYLKCGWWTDREPPTAS